MLERQRLPALPLPLGGAMILLSALVLADAVAVVRGRAPQAAPLWTITAGAALAGRNDAERRRGAA